MAAARGSTHETTAAPSTLGSSATLQRPLTGTMGMFIVDTFAYIDPITGENLGDKARGEQLGGGGLYFAIGARMWLPPGDVLMVIDRGTDFHPAWQNTLDHYAFPCPASSRYRHDRPADSSCQAMWRWRDRTDARTTKAVNVYKGEQRGFDYLTPKLRLEPNDLARGTPPRLPRWIHCICSPDRMRAILNQVQLLDACVKHHDHSQTIVSQRTRICWEPIPDSCRPENLDACLRLMSEIDVISPNYDEAAALLSVALDDFEVPSVGHTEVHRPGGMSSIGTSDADIFTASSSNLPDRSLSDVRQINATKLATLLLERFHSYHSGDSDGNTKVARQTPLIVIRSGAAGSLALVELLLSSEPDCQTVVVAADVPAFHSADQADAVRDVTGGGNSFLGGLVAYLASHPQPMSSHSGADTIESTTMLWLREALQWGAISASFVIEQFGLPSLTLSEDTRQELWNGESVKNRQMTFLERLRTSSTQHSGP